MNSNILRMLPLLILFLLSLTIGFGLFDNRDENVDIANQGKKFSAFELPSLGKSELFTPALFGDGRVLIVNIFASWCEPCAAEHELLMNLARSVNIYGIAWKDNPADTLKYLQERGNPFQQIGIDETGITTVPMAITGVPETFILDKSGAIALHYKAALTEDIIANVFMPLIKTLNAQDVK
jgi:cytochrome c biogenesis protein CcmG, thiol:disulfide interchange protein DsbE